MEGGRQYSNVSSMRINLYALKLLIVLANYPPKVQAPMWGLNKRCSSPPRKLSLKNSNFYPSPLIKGLSDYSIGRLFGLLEGQTHGLRPWVGQHAPRAEVYGGDPTGWYIKLGSGGLSSISTGTIEHENLKRVVLQGWYKFRLRGRI